MVRFLPSIIKKVALNHFFNKIGMMQLWRYTQVSLYTRSQFSPRIFLISCSL